MTQDLIQDLPVTYIAEDKKNLIVRKFENFLQFRKTKKREIEQKGCTNTNIKPEQDGLPRLTIPNHVWPNN